jgi:hypothetical protein
MTDQFGKHDATGPRGRRADGTVDPAGYVRSRLAVRRNVMFHGVYLIAWSVILLVREGGGLASAFLVFAGLLVLDVATMYLFRFVAGRREQRRRASAQAPSWPAHLVAVLQAREAGLDIPAGIRGDSSLPGRLTQVGDRWLWTAKQARNRPAIATLTLPADWLPTLNPKLGYRHILTFLGHGGARLDFGIGARRDLRRHVQGHRH